jgi:hypothetical protein
MFVRERNFQIPTGLSAGARPATFATPLVIGWHSSILYSFSLYLFVFD